MFRDLSEKLESVFKKLRGQGRLSEANISDAMREVRRALLEADVNFKVVKDFIGQVQQKALGQDVLQSVSPGQQVIKVVHDQLSELMGHAARELDLSGTPPQRIMLVGLQGSGKTTTASKLAAMLRHKGKRPLLVAADVHRPAAIDQLITLGKSLSIPVYSERDAKAVAICKNAFAFAAENHCDLIIFDTAGRQHVDEEMMQEVFEIKEVVTPSEILFVADAMTGQDAVNAAKAFHDRLGFTGVILTKMDGDARGGAALSILAVTGCPIKFIGTSEKTDGIEVFHPDRMASRILGMGDIVSLVERAQEAVSQKDAEEMERKLRKAEFTFEDFLAQLQQVKKMGPLQEVLAMIPGANKLGPLDVDEKTMGRTEAIVRSMTIAERRKPDVIDGSRRKRIARGSGTSVQDVNRLLKQFDQMRKMMKQMSKFGGKASRMPGMFPGM